MQAGKGIKMARKIYIVGIGLGNPASLTVQAKNLIAKADAIIGAERMVEAVASEHGNIPTYCEIAADKIIKRAEDLFAGQGNINSIVVVMSGDVGFYSGAKKLTDQLKEGSIDFELIPGISSLQYMAARFGLPWDSMAVVSLHGRKANPLGAIYNNRRSFLLLGNYALPNDVCKSLTEMGLGDLYVYIGEHLSYPEEKIRRGKARDFINEKDFSSLSVMVVENLSARKNSLVSHGLADESFIRGNLPMTKEEVRTIAISKLRLEGDDIVYDVGSGTGSIACEIGLRLLGGRVYAIERNEEGVDLIKKNARNFHLQNVIAVAGEAPQALSKLPKPDKVFIGGSKGQMAGIVRCLLDKNPKVRLVITAIALETLSESLEILKSEGFKNIDIVELFPARTRELGSYMMMQGLNPVFIISAGGVDG